jgi:putative endonuclease
MFAVYVLYSYGHNQIYVGYTSDLINRFHSHNHYSKKGHTVKFRPWSIIHAEFFMEQKEAMAREKQLKSSQGRIWIRSNFDRTQGFISVG